MSSPALGETEVRLLLTQNYHVLTPVLQDEAPVTRKVVIRFAFRMKGLSVISEAQQSASRCKSLRSNELP